MRSPFCYFRSGYRRLKRFFIWFPVLWRDEDWDSAYLFEIMRFKISRIRKEIEKNKRHVGYEKNVRDMKVAEELLRRFAFNGTYSDFYYELSEQLENAEKKGKCVCPEEVYRIEPGEIDPKTGKKGFSRFVSYSCAYCKARQSYWFKQEEIKQKEDLDFLFMHLKKHVKKWWD